MPKKTIQIRNCMFILFYFSNHKLWSRWFVAGFAYAMGFYIRMHDYNSLNLINITQNLLHGGDQASPLWFYVPDSPCWKKHTLHFQTLTVGLNELLNSRRCCTQKTRLKLSFTFSRFYFPDVKSTYYQSV